MGSHVCLGGVIYTLGVNDRGSHLCLGVIYASDTGSKRSCWLTNSDRGLPVRSRCMAVCCLDSSQSRSISGLNLQHELKTIVFIFNVTFSTLPASIHLQSAVAEKIPFQSEHWTPEWVHVNQYFSGASRAMRRKFASWSPCMTSLTRQFKLIALQLVFYAVPRTVCHPKDLFGSSTWLQQNALMQLKFALVMTKY